MNSPRPFIIWTLQRTGGTNLAHQLTLRSGLQGTEHEPLNPGRRFGHITADWLRDKDDQALRRELEDVCQRGVVIKHCVEMVPWEVSEALARASAAAGYRHLFLYRRNAVDRLLSLHFARQTGVWGPKAAPGEALNGYPSASGAGADSERGPGGAVAERLPVDNLISHEKSCVETLRTVWSLLQSLGSMPRAIAYEDIYRTADALQPRRVLLPILQYLDLSEGEASDAVWVSEVVGTGDQGTRDRYREFPGVAELAERIKTISPFLSEAEAIPVIGRVASDLPPWVVRCVVDVVPSGIHPGQEFEIGGVLVLASGAPDGLALRMTGSGNVVQAKWDLPSQRMGQLYPDAKNAVRARFLLSGVAFASGETRLALELQGPDFPATVVVEIRQVDPPDYSRVYVEPMDRLVFDVGANDGSDTWYYLRKGFRVVAVEPEPDLADALRQKLGAQIAARRLIVESVAVAEQEGEVLLTVNEDRSEWSSTHGAAKATAGRNRTVSVPSTTLAALVQRHGTPYYVKIDIEGGELAAVESLAALAPEALPPLLSFEVNLRFGDVLECLYRLGYVKFQLVRQGAAFLPVCSGVSAEGLDYLCLFSSNMSGPFGRDLPRDGWVGLVEIIRSILKAQEESQAGKVRGDNPAWYDVHAVRSTEIITWGQVRG